MLMKRTATAAILRGSLSIYLMVVGTAIVSAIHHPTADIHYHRKMENHVGPAMWSFGARSGVNVWSVDGQSLLRSHTPADLPMCGPTDASNDVPVCSFFAFASDGHEYVWAGAFGPDRVDVFDIDTADYVSYIPTCSTPLDLDYHPHRKEMWLQCAGTNEDTADGHLDVFSTNTLSANFDLVNLNVTGRSYGRQVLDSSLGIFGYTTVFNQPFLYKIDLAMRKIDKRIPLELSSGAYDMAYSPLNRHIYIRSRVTCTCGDETKDIVSCGQFGGGTVDILTGPSAGKTQVEGTSGKACEGSAADTIGVYEFDTKTDRIVGSHNILEGTGQGATPVASPDGKYVVLLGNDGGQYVRLLRPNVNAALSSVVADIPVKFSGGYATQMVITDVAFMTAHGQTILVLASGTDNNIALVNLENPTNVVKVALTSSSQSTGAGDGGRSVEWADGTDFVWVTGPEAEEVYVINIPRGDISAAKLFATIKSTDATALVYVENFASTAASMRVASSNFLASAIEQSPAIKTNVALSSAAITLSCIALLFCLWIVCTRPMSSAPNSPKTVKDVTASEDMEMALDMKSLGSKQVN
ncbi:hypothetical protein IV203_033569 [Nitzschia inconspicua]|uniref:Uncharacterized protein n=1 Tax=Nitzschia inconspicua TaxID=303405 RepID=A0A9K3M2K2_9STRA|nr:hypothetical protein IV203_033569 [Nitzschia inconspicua]